MKSLAIIWSAVVIVGIITVLYLIYYINSLPH